MTPVEGRGCAERAELGAEHHEAPLLERGDQHADQHGGGPDGETERPGRLARRVAQRALGRRFIVAFGGAGAAALVCLVARFVPVLCRRFSGRLLDGGLGRSAVRDPPRDRHRQGQARERHQRSDREAEREVAGHQPAGADHEVEGRPSLVDRPEVCEQASDRRQQRGVVHHVADQLSALKEEGRGGRQHERGEQARPLADESAANPVGEQQCQQTAQRQRQAAGELVDAEHLEAGRHQPTRTAPAAGCSGRPRSRRRSCRIRRPRVRRRPDGSRPGPITRNRRAWAGA